MGTTGQQGGATMSHHAHGTQRSRGTASRTRDMYQPSNRSTFFDELHPHLRHVTAGQQTLAERIHGYLLRRGPRTMKQLYSKFGESGSLQHCLDTNFVKVGNQWKIKG
jgi:hypothetical protein